MMFKTVSWIIFFSSIAIFSSVHSHSYLADPYPYTTECKGCSVCPSERRKPSQMHYTRNNPVVTWYRGQKVNIKWVRNNHNGGFIRLSLLNTGDTFNDSAHNHFSFYYGCWEQGPFNCEGRECGLDRKGRAFHRFITIPDNIPDGTYTFAFMWYGGAEFRRNEGLFSDFTSCAYVRIVGGAEIKSSFQPFFEPGKLGKFEHNGMCLTTSNMPGQCLHGCPGKPTFYDIPQSFKDGNQPAPIMATEYGYRNDSHQQAKKETKNKRLDTAQSDSYICNHKLRTCCSAICGRCAQEQCAQRQGGIENCCPKYIHMHSGRKCLETSAPCYYAK